MLRKKSKKLHYFSAIEQGVHEVLSSALVRHFKRAIQALHA